jgi:hypothetical protein
MADIRIVNVNRADSEILWLFTQPSILFPQSPVPYLLLLGLTSVPPMENGGPDTMIKFHGGLGFVFVCACLESEHPFSCRIYMMYMW